MTLDDLKHTRRTMRGTEVIAANAVERAQRQVADDLLRVREGERRLDAARDRLTYDAECVVLESGRKDHALAIKRLTDRQGEHAQAQKQARAAEAQVMDAVDQVLLAEREAIAIECIEIHRQLTRKIAELRAVVPDELNTPVHLAADISSVVEQALSLVPPPDATQVPVNVLQYGAHGDAEAWAARRARMIADEAIEEATAA